jgi:hypothetical protein
MKRAFRGSKLEIAFGGNHFLILSPLKIAGRGEARRGRCFRGSQPSKNWNAPPEFRDHIFILTPRAVQAGMPRIRFGNLESMVNR